MLTPTYNQFQQVFSLNWLSNTLANVKAPYNQLQPLAHQSITEVLENQGAQTLIGGWDLVWGPIVFSAHNNGDKSVADNTMYLVKSNSEDTYVLAIAGTNPISPYGWFIEDFATSTTQKWPFDPSISEDSDVVVSTGTYIGIQHLLQMKDGANNDMSVVEYLASISDSVSPQTQLIVTGHSLGGALSASLGLALLNMQTQNIHFPLTNPNGNGEPIDEDPISISAWDKNQNFIVCTMPSAGATPGNEKFANYYDQLLGARTIRVWNRIDVVPHGWNKQMLIESPFLYTPEIKPGALVVAAAGVALAHSLKSGKIYTQIMAQVPGYNGQVNQAIIHKNEIIALIDQVGEAEIEKILEITLHAAAEKLHIKEEWLHTFADILAKIVVSFLQDKMDKEIQKLIDSLPNELKDLLHIIYTEANNLMEYLVQLGYQHVQAYVEFIGVEVFNDIMAAHKPKTEKLKEEHAIA
jgi:hypothetical protein